MKPIQYLIFLGTFLVISSIINLFLFIDLTDINDQLIKANETNSNLSEQFNQNNSKTESQKKRLDMMTEQQTDVSVIINELSSQLDELNKKYIATAETSTQTKKLLSDAMKQVKKLQKSISEQTYKIAESEKTIQNQQRLLRATLSQHNNISDEKIQIQLAELSSRFQENGNSDIISIAQKSNGQSIIVLPLDLLFVDNELTLKDSANETLEAIATTLITLSASDFVVIGHSDPRPIKSSLAQLYPTNWELSSVRASKIVQHLVNLGVPANQLTAAGKASSALLRDEAEETAWRLNRRIEIQIQP